MNQRQALMDRLILLLSLLVHSTVYQNHHLTRMT
uniref:Uncharacterized protein n=1 Tax=virus sp. ctx9V1 TaxID=2828001 RepID=A0A8S5RCV0_9VIRU|nr:MAG TPA: hypothetical protein [virus sp. ctx9V1]